MSREILQDIIDDFSPEKFSRFFREKNRSFAPRGESFAHYDDEYFTGGFKIGEIGFSECEKLLVCAFSAGKRTDPSSGGRTGQPLSERSGKKAQYEKGKRILKDTHADAGIFIFYDEEGNFRFSLIYDIPKEKGRRDWSSFRRFTYFVSREFTNKTFLQRIGDGGFPTLDKIKDAFSVEKVTKEFYEQYRKLFDALVTDLSENRAFQMAAAKNQINTADFSKKLLGQIVFLYFLQKKGWLGVPQNKPWGEGDKNFVSSLFKQAAAKKENFYDDYLEILFYDTLNNAHREGADTSFSKHFNCRIPFLNGGLFEPEYDWRGTKIYLENTIFKNIFEIFDRYNFTVEEDSPDDKEVAVDPEMLGKVFENLLEENLRKGRGTYYTPREIVHYMCQESLINYLKTASGLEDKVVRPLVIEKDADKLTGDDAEKLDALLADIKVCDPACGSGAFLVGMLHEIISARLLMNPGAGEYGLKKETIQSCIYGVDIDPGAVEIAKLRLWLSLVVDYELADIEPLPNLDYKVMCGNSLLEELVIGGESIKLFDEKLLSADNKKNAKTALFDENDFEGTRASDKDGPFQKLLKEKQKIMLDLHNQGKLTAHRKKELDKEIAEIQKTLKPKKKITAADFQYQFADKAGEYFVHLRKLHKQYFTEYDSVKKKQVKMRIEAIELEFIKSAVQERVNGIEDRIKNLNMQNPEDRKKQAVLMKRKLEYMSIPGEIHRSKVRPYFLWHLNFFEVFQEKGGFDVMIANPPYVNIVNLPENMRGAYKKIFYVTKNKVDLYAYFIEKGFGLLKKDALLTFIIPQTWKATSSFTKLREIIFKHVLQEIVDLDFGVFDAVVKPVIIFALNQTSENYEIVVKNRNFEAVQKINVQEVWSNAQKELDTQSPIEFKAVFQSIETGAIPLSQIIRFSRGIKTSNDKKFIIANVEKLNNEHFKVFRGKNIKAYTIAWGNEYVWYRPDFMRKKEGCLPHSREFFEVPEKIVTQRVNSSMRLLAAYDDQKRYFLDTVNVSDYETWRKDIPMKFICALLNSTVINFYYCNKYRMPTIGGYELHSIPIKLGTEKIRIRVCGLVDKILSIDANNEEKKREIMVQINQIVHEIYGLTPEEIAIVEGAVPDESEPRRKRSAGSRFEKVRS